MSLDNETALAVIRHAEGELAVKRSEIELQEKQEDTRRLEIETNAKVAMAQIEAQERDLKDNRTQYNSMLTRRYWFVGVVVLMILVFATVGMMTGHKDIVIEIMKATLFFAAGGFGGYQYGKSKQDK